MENNEDASLEFDYFYEGKMVVCRVETGESDYGIHFNGELMAVIEMINDGLWEINGTGLDDDDVQRIGKQIEDHYA